MFAVTEKNGKTLHLLKSSSKKTAGIKKRKKIELMGTIGQFKESKKAPAPPSQQQQPAGSSLIASAASMLAPKPSQPPRAKDAKMNNN